jgi:heptosyltransferase-2
MESLLVAGRILVPNVTPSDTSSFRSIFVLRNNDLGDLLGITPMFEALKKTWPDCCIGVGVGDWARPMLENNPWVDDVLTVNAPWHNKATTRQGLLSGLGYALFSPEVKALAKRRFDAGLDPLGSQLGSLLLMRSGIPTRIGVKGYAGGHSACSSYIQFDENRHIGKAALDSAKMLDAKIDEIETKPQLFLSPEEEAMGEREWDSSKERRRVIIAPGAGFAEKCWPLENFILLAKRITEESSTEIVILGSKEDAKDGIRIEEAVNSAAPKNDSKVRNLCGRTDLRKTFAITSRCDAVVSNTSLLMHVAGAFSIPNLVLLGPWYDSAKLHAKQWGHEKTIVAGRETEEGFKDLTPPEEAYDLFRKCLEDQPVSQN